MNQIMKYFFISFHLASLVQCGDQALKNNKSSTNLISLLALHAITTPTLSYGPSNIALTVNSSMANLNPIATNFTPTTYSVNPALPSGISISSSSGIISGTPSQLLLTKTSFKITATSYTSSAITMIYLLVGNSGLFRCSYSGTIGGCLDASIGYTCNNSPSCFSTLSNCSASDYCL